jgi:hypothetical protein
MNLEILSLGLLLVHQIITFRVYSLSLDWFLQLTEPSSVVAYNS